MRKTLRIGHSPDADDAFMFYALTEGRVRVDGYDIVHVMEDIESLNRRALCGELEVTAISAAAYPGVAERYRVMASGASMGRGYGPIVVSKAPAAPQDLSGRRIAIPGRHTTAFLLLRLRLADFQPVEVPFDRIPRAVLAGEVDAGLLIHEGQITYQALGLRNVLDLGEWWRQETRLPLPLGLDVVRRDLGEALGQRISVALRESIEYAFAHEGEALAYAMGYSRGITLETCRRFVRMYVNEYTMQMGEEGQQALKTLYEMAFQRGLIASQPPVDLI
ncbi:MAG: MqnA/MqnD/SBP family protein [Chloroflexota bacterium]|nr:MqnA/MqnD/SBP family protein [Chloroflexota bacterium]